LLQFVGQAFRFRPAFGDDADHLEKGFVGYLGSKAHTGEVGAVEELGEAQFGWSGFDGQTVDEQAVIGHGKLQALSFCLGKHRLQMDPGIGRLRNGLRVRHTVHARGFQKDIEAAEKASRGRAL
jgi:hypothetical protein